MMAGRKLINGVSEKMKRLIPIMLMAAFMFVSGCADDLQDGRDAYSRGDDKAAFEKFKPLAEQGNAVAQNQLGVMYAEGQGTPKNHKEVVKWYRLSAEQGNAGVQNKMGWMYTHGKGVPQDDVLAHMWFSLADSLGDKNAIKNRNLLENLMTPAQIAEAQKLAKEWMEERGRE